MKKIISIIILTIFTLNFYGQMVPMSVGVELENDKPKFKQKKSDLSNTYIVITNCEKTMEILDNNFKDLFFFKDNDARWYFIPKKKRKKVDKLLAGIERQV